MVKKLLIIGSVSIFSLLLIAGLSASAEGRIVRSGKIAICPSKTVDQMVSGFIGNPQWHSNIINESQTNISVEGKVNWQGEPSTMKLEFIANEKAGKFDVGELQINNQPMSPFLRTGVLIKMCRS